MNHIAEVKPEQLVVLPPRRVQALCARPYRGHPRGCPNYGRRKGCPPKVKSLGVQQGRMWLVWNVYDLQAHEERARKRHPDWTKAQCRNSRHWQGKARAQLRRLVLEFLSVDEHRRRWATVLYVPEAHGLDVTATMANVAPKEKLEWPPEGRAYQVALVILPKGLSRATML